MPVRWPRLLRHALLLALVALAATALPLAAQSEPVWTEPDGQGGANVHLYVFHSYNCPHCQEALPFFEQLAEETPWLKLHELEITTSRANAEQYVRFGAALGQEAIYVPGFFFCGQMVTGYDNPQGMGAGIAAALDACHEDALLQVAAAASAEGAAATAPLAANPGAEQVAEAAAAISLPFVGKVSVESLSLPVLTVVLGGLDAFNPCAFFVLMFLLSLMVHARNRSRMLLIGGVFVLFSGLIYFVFMSAWLNIFLWVGELKVITLLAGLVAIVIGLINIKDFFWFKQGVSLGIPDSAKPGLFARMRKLVSADSLPTMLGSTVVLAIAANSYELLCTSGFPMVYTRALTLHDLPRATFYGYLALYNLVYILPLLLIVTVFAVRFGAHKLSENEGRVLKLLSGLMMLLLGVLLVVAPTTLNNPLVALGLLAAALLITFVAVQVEKRRAPKKPPAKGTGTKPGSKPKHKQTGHTRAAH